MIKIPKSKWRWLLIPLSPIAMSVGIVVGISMFIKKKKWSENVR
jgi:hypothetical protein